jgi:hypothetical protein
MTLSRRKMLTLIGGGTILAAGAGVASFAATRTPHAALAPWMAAGRYGEPRLNALSWALLAPNPHNLQPWQAELVGSDRVRIWREAGRILPHTDPHERQITIGMGCFLELMVLAAGAEGCAVDLTLFPEGEAGPVAEARFIPAAASEDALFRHAPDRRSCKEPFADRPLPATLAADLTTDLAPLGRVHTDPAMVAALRDLTWTAFQIEATTPRTWQESVDLTRIGRRAIEAQPDGIAVGGVMMEVFGALGMASASAQADPTSVAFRSTMDMYRAMLAATPAYVSMVTPGNARSDQIAAGRRWMRLNLTTTALGLALHPVSQALQEYPEMAEPFARAHDLLAEPGETVQMLGRLGYGPDAPRSPRWPLEARMRHA